MPLFLRLCWTDLPGTLCQVLERDAANMELRFDLEARAAEADRLRRRTKELHFAMGTSGGGGGGGARKDVAGRPPGARFKRER